MWALLGFQSDSNKPKFREKILDLYDSIFIEHENVKKLDFNFLHPKVNRTALYNAVRTALMFKKHTQSETIILFNGIFEFCINSLVDDKEVIIQHAFQTLSVMTIAVGQSNRYLSMSDVLVYMCDHDSFEHLFEMLLERITHIILTDSSDLCKEAALELTLCMMGIAPNMHSNLFTEFFLTRNYHKRLFKLLKVMEKNDLSYQSLSSHSLSPTIDEEKEEKIENDDDDSVMITTDSSCMFKQPRSILFLVLLNFTILCHYQRYEDDNPTLKYLQSIKTQSTNNINRVLNTISVSLNKQMMDELVAETPLDQLNNAIQSFSSFISATLWTPQPYESKTNTESIDAQSSQSDLNSPHSIHNNSSEIASQRQQKAEQSISVRLDKLLSLDYHVLVVLLSLYLLLTYHNPGYMVHSAALRKSTPAEVHLHPKVFVSPSKCPAILREFIAMSSCIFQKNYKLNLAKNALFEVGSANAAQQQQPPITVSEKDVLMADQLTRLCLVIYARLTEIPACMISLYSRDFAGKPRVSYAKLESGNIVNQVSYSKPIASNVFDILCDYAVNIGRILTAPNRSRRRQHNHTTKQMAITEAQGTESSVHVSPQKISSAHSSQQQLHSMDESLLDCLRLLLDIFLRCLIFQNQMQLHFSQSSVILRLVNILLNLMKVFLKHQSSPHFSTTYKHQSLEIMSRSVCLIRIVIGCHKKTLDEHTSLIASFFLQIAKHTKYFQQFSELIHLVDATQQKKNKNQSQKSVKKDAIEENLVSQRLKKDTRVLCRVAKFFEDAITLEFKDFHTSAETPSHTKRALRLVRATLKAEEFETPPPKLDGQYLGYLENKPSEIKFFNRLIKDVISNFVSSVFQT